MEIVKYPLNEGQYSKQEGKKTQIVLHHTASSSSAKNVINGWNADSRQVGTAYVIDNQGIVYEAFDPKYWAASIGYYIEGVGGNSKAYELLPGTNNRQTNLGIEMRSIGIELTNWGNLTFKDGKYYSYVNTVIPIENVIKLESPFRGFQFYEKYSSAQIQSLEQLIRTIGAKFNIPLKFSQLFDFDKNTVLGTPGITLHVNCRFDKTDLYPSKEMKEMLAKFK